MDEATAVLNSSCWGGGRLGSGQCVPQGPFECPQTLVCRTVLWGPAVRNLLHLNGGQGLIIKTFPTSVAGFFPAFILHFCFGLPFLISAPFGTFLLLVAGQMVIRGMGNPENVLEVHDC